MNSWSPATDRGEQVTRAVIAAPPIASKIHCALSADRQDRIDRPRVVWTLHWSDLVSDQYSGGDRPLDRSHLHSVKVCIAQSSRDLAVQVSASWNPAGALRACAAVAEVDTAERNEAAWKHSSLKGVVRCNVLVNVTMNQVFSTHSCLAMVSRSSLTPRSSKMRSWSFAPIL